jgi:hypothetical protein
MTDADFVDVGLPLSPSEAGMLEFELERRGIALRLRICDRETGGDRQVVQVAPADLSRALAIRGHLFPSAPPEAPPAPRAHRLRNGLIAGALGLVASLRLVRFVPVPRGAATTLVVFGFAGTLFAAAYGLSKDRGGPAP